ncbi:hypothetical protein PGTUg99_004370 [Puccinia graminis f. sp. tritici]|uniref:Uncharacterized protein n=1 Tax=Puccinia graminis f. sp. tritici TaxID=56615 RepID=A0A5B0RDN0_PUCGR|nr:hypothetical protein PGTUg99_004370 [Puccinia graminis f. sp. tritici]
MLKNGLKATIRLYNFVRNDVKRFSTLTATDPLYKTPFHENEQRARYKRLKLSTKSEPKKNVLKPELEILKQG